MTADLEQLLRDFLSRDDEEHGSVRASLGALERAMQVQETANQARHSELLRLVEVASVRLQTIEQRVDRLEGAQEDTGRHNLETLRSRVRAHEASLQHWWRYAVGVIVTVLISGLSAAVTHYLR